MQLRDATPEDLDAVVALTQRRRAQLAAWEEHYWRPSAEADVLHRMWLDHLIQSDAPARVVVDGDELCAFAVAMNQGDQWFVDDLSVAAGRWPDAGTLLLTSVPEQPALICVPSGDDDAHVAGAAAGVAWVSSYWLRRTDPAADASGATLVVADVAPDPALVAPPHTMKSAHPDAPAMLAWTDDDGGVVIASPPVPAPPIYDPGGTTCVIDRVHGDDRAALVHAAVRTAARRGDVGVVIVAGTDDHELLSVLADGAWRHVVDIGRLAPAPG